MKYKSELIKCQSEVELQKKEIERLSQELTKVAKEPPTMRMLTIAKGWRAKVSCWNCEQDNDMLIPFKTMLKDVACLNCRVIGELWIPHEERGNQKRNDK